MLKRLIALAAVLTAACDDAPAIWYFRDPRTSTCFAVVTMHGSKTATAVPCSREVNDLIRHVAITDTSEPHGHN